MTADLITWLRGVLDEDERDWLIVRDQVIIQPMFAGRHLPTASLADIAAKRAILDLCEHWIQLQVIGGYDAVAALAATRQQMIATLRLLATAYADRPGYRQEWKP